jgi:uncharacterized protein (TIGR00730 family)
MTGTGSNQQPSDTEGRAATAGPPEPRPLRAICVYCASSTGTNQAVIDAAGQLGRLLADQGVELVYGGGAVGLMGLIADTVMDGGGRVTGVIPSSLMPREVAHRGITELVEVDSMYTRKAEMMARADGFIAMPGGFGTLEELTEVLTWAQLGIHDKPIGLLNPDGFYDHLLALLDRCIADQVLREQNRSLLVEDADPGRLLDKLRAPRPGVEPKWITTPTPN